MTYYLYIMYMTLQSSTMVNHKYDIHGYKYTILFFFQIFGWVIMT